MSECCCTAHRHPYTQGPILTRSHLTKGQRKVPILTRPHLTKGQRKGPNLCTPASAHPARYQTTAHMGEALCAAHTEAYASASAHAAPAAWTPPPASWTPTPRGPPARPAPPPLPHLHPHAGPPPPRMPPPPPAVPPRQRLPAAPAPHAAARPPAFKHRGYRQACTYTSLANQKRPGRLGQSTKHALT